MQVTYKTYPRSKKLTAKSRSLATLTHPVIAMCIGAMPGMICLVFLAIPMPVPAVLAMAGAVAGLVLAPRIRKKKYAEYDAEYAKILQAEK